MKHYGICIFLSFSTAWALPLPALQSYKGLSQELAVQTAINEANAKTKASLLRKIKKVSLDIGSGQGEGPYLESNPKVLKSEEKAVLMRLLGTRPGTDVYWGSRNFQHGKLNLFTMDFKTEDNCSGFSNLFLEKNGKIALIKESVGAEDGIRLLIFGKPESLVIESLSHGGGSGGSYEYQVIDANGATKPSFKEFTWQDGFHHFEDIDDDGIPELFFCSKSFMPDSIRKKFEANPELDLAFELYETRLWKWDGKTFHKLGSYFDQRVPGSKSKKPIQRAYFDSIKGKCVDEKPSYFK